MLASHNVLNPANGTPLTLPSQDMVLGLYYLTKEKVSTKKEIVKGEGMTFYSPEEVIIANNEKVVDIHAKINVKTKDLVKGELVEMMIATTAGRVIFNELVPEAVGFVNELLTKKALRAIIGNILKITGTSRTVEFLDEIKTLGYHMAFKGGLSFNLDDIMIPPEKDGLVDKAHTEVEEVMNPIL
jgi:DNA-directed RNA polymerase subunit beta'